MTAWRAVPARSGRLGRVVRLECSLLASVSVNSTNHQAMTCQAPRAGRKDSESALIRLGNNVLVRGASRGGFAVAIGLAVAVGVAIGVVAVVARPILPPDQGHTVD